LKKSAVLFNVLGVFLFPFVIVLAFTSVSSLATLYYEFLPSWLDFAIKFFYDLASYTLDLAVFFALGAFCYALAQKNILSAVLVAVLGIINAGVLPIIQFFVRSLFFASSTEAYIMQEYWTNDVITSMTELLKFGIGALICIATRLFFKLSKRDDKFSHPYVKPNGVVSVSALIISAALTLSSLIIFATGGEYGVQNIIYLILSIVFNVVVYFALVFGGYMEKRSFCPKKD